MGSDPAKSAHPRRTDFPADQPGHRQHSARLPRRDLGTLFTREPSAEAKFAELTVRANTGLGAEKAVEH